MINLFRKLKDWIVKLYWTYKNWVHKQKVNRHASFIRRKARLQYKLKVLDDKFTAYFKKVEYKKQKLQDRLNKVNKKLGKLDQILGQEFKVEKNLKKKDNTIESLENTQKNVLTSKKSLEAKNI